MADKVIDTSKLNVHELRQQLRELVSGRKQASKLVLTFVSFGFKNGPPAEADLMFDVRFLKNPHWVPALRPQTGKDPAVAAYIRRQPTARDRDQAADVVAALDGAALRAGREELPDRRDRLHRRPASIGVCRRGAEARARRTSRASRRECRAPRPGEGRDDRRRGRHPRAARHRAGQRRRNHRRRPAARSSAVSIGWHEDVQDARDEIAAAIDAGASGRTAC